VQVCYADVPRPQTAQSCGANSFDARQTNLTEMYWYRQYLPELKESRARG